MLNNEQERIVLEIERQMSILDDLDASVAMSLEKVDRLRSAVLAHAFRGQLVQQDPCDEPAAALLERIKVVRNESGFKQHRLQRVRG